MKVNYRDRSIRLSAIVGLALLGAVGIVSNVHAESYQSTVGLGFTFNPSITISVSGDLTINELSPGNYADSNIITVGVTTNTLGGYYLSATAGTSSTNNRLNHASANYYFTSLSSNVATMNNASDNTWGYSYSVDNGTNWISGDINNNPLSGYNGLPLDNDDDGATGIALVDTTTPADNESIKFKIGAKAATTQAAGTYTNTINFYAIGYPDPPKDISNSTTMQEVEACPATLATGQVYTLTDTRDDQEYTVAKLADGKCWMTKNLNLAGGTALSSDDTDMGLSWTLPTANGFQANNKLPLPATSGIPDDSTAYVYNSNSTTCGNNHPCYSYYTWTAATIGSGLSKYIDNTDAPYSICPKGWKLPTSRTTSAANWQTTSYYHALVLHYGVSTTTSTLEYSDGFYNLAGLNTTPNFLLAGDYYNGSYYSGGTNGYYWSSTSSGSNTARSFRFRSDFVDTAESNYRRLGYAVRCLFSGS